MIFLYGVAFGILFIKVLQWGQVVHSRRLLEANLAVIETFQKWVDATIQFNQMMAAWGKMGIDRNTLMTAGLQNLMNRNYIEISDLDFQSQGKIAKLLAEEEEFSKEVHLQEEVKDKLFKKVISIIDGLP